MSTPAVRHFTRFVLRPQDEQLTPVELWFEDKQLPGGLFALGRLFEVGSPSHVEGEPKGIPKNQASAAWGPGKNPAAI